MRGPGGRGPGGTGRQGGSGRYRRRGKGKPGKGGRIRSRVAASIPLQEDIYIVDGRISPFGMGIIRPRIYLSEGLSGKEQEFNRFACNLLCSLSWQWRRYFFQNGRSAQFRMKILFLILHITKFFSATHPNHPVSKGRVFLTVSRVNNGSTAAPYIAH